MRPPQTYDLVVGTGGIGSGMFLALDGDHTLGREESRAATPLDQRDSCKLHNVCHYARTLLGPDVPVLPIGAVGDDDAGRAVLDAMRSTGLDLSFVTVSARPTLFSVCFLYPNSDGGNLTTARSASDDVGPEDVERVAATLADHRGTAVAVAMPEVPLAARLALLRLATEHDGLRVGSVVSGEVEEALACGLLDALDVLAVNLDEAAALAGVSADVGPGAGTEGVVTAAVDRIAAAHPQLGLVVTAGRHGSWTWDGRSLSHAAAVDVRPVSTAGAGDAHVAGLVVALAAGLDLTDANRFATLLSGLKVTSPHTINPEISAAAVLEAADRFGSPLPEPLRALLARTADAGGTVPDRTSAPARAALDGGMPLRSYRPRARVVLPEHLVTRARFPAIDAHSHLGRWLGSWVGRDGEWLVPEVPEFLDAAAGYGVHGFVNLDGRWGDELRHNLDRFDHRHPGRVATFCHLDWSLLKEPGAPEALVANLRDSTAAGAAGVKVWKDLGLHVRDGQDRLVLPDDERLDPFWATAGELGVPVWWHVADPRAFFDPVDERNEYLEMLGARPDWSFSGPQFPSFDRLMESLETVVSRHPGTTFVAVHGGGYAEDLGWVGRLLATYPNLHIDIAARLAQLGRQPRAMRALCLAHPDRVLFGADEIPPTGGSYPTHFRFLETADEYFPHSDEDPPLFGRWAISGLDLPDDVLRQVYSGNAVRLVPRLAPAVGGGSAA